jgi:hypothetical protein
VILTEAAAISNPLLADTPERRLDDRRVVLPDAHRGLLLCGPLNRPAGFVDAA